MVREVQASVIRAASEWALFLTKDTKGTVLMTTHELLAHNFRLAYGGILDAIDQAEAHRKARGES